MAMAASRILIPTVQNENENMTSIKGGGKEGGKGLGGVAGPKKRNALGNLSQSEINSRRQNNDHSGGGMKKKVMSSSSSTTAPSIFIEKTVTKNSDDNSSEFSIDDMICSSMAFPSSLPADAGDYVDALVAAKKAKRSSSRQYNPASRVAFQSPYSKQMKPHFDIPQVDISFSSDHDIFPQSTLPNIDMADDDLLKLLE